MKRIKISFILNALIVLLVVIGCICMFADINFMPVKNEVLVSNKLEMLKYYTVDSNILIGIVSFVLLIYEYLYFKKKINNVPKFAYVLKYVGTSTIALTFITTLVFLSPRYGFYSMYNNSNLIFHLIVPLLSFTSYVFFEKYSADYKEGVFGILPMLVYAIYYTGNIFSHLNSGGLTSKYDFYGFLFGNIYNAVIVAPIIVLVTYLIGLLVLYLNKEFKK